MFDSLELQKALLALILGLLIGAERERSQMQREERDAAGIRSFAIVALLGYFSAFLGKTVHDSFPLFVFGGFMLLIITSYAYDAFVRHKKGITSEIAALITLIVGIICYYHPLYAVILAITITVILSLKFPLHDFVKKVNEEEFYATLKFAIIAFVILPILPDYAVDPWGIVNPYEIWLLIVLISGISFIGYIFTKLIGPSKGIALSGIMGGVVSSTAVASSMAAQSGKNQKMVFPYVLAVTSANTIMFARTLLITALINYQVAKELIFIFSFMIGISIFFILFLFFHAQKYSAKIGAIKLESPFHFIPALKFGIFFLCILAVVGVLQRLGMGENGFYITALISGFVDTDAINLSMSRLATEHTELLVTAAYAITIAALTNTVVKAIFAFVFGGKVFARYIFVYAILIIICGIAGMAGLRLIG